MLPLIGYLQSMRYGIAIAMLSALLLFSCQSIKTAEPAESPAEDDMTMVIELEENPSTGYTWSCSMMGTGRLRMKDDSFMQPEAELMGAPGIRRFEFAGEESGHVTLSFFYSRPWEDVSPARTIAYSVEVADDLSLSYI